jgi:hypothetical protein
MLRFVAHSRSLRLSLSPRPTAGCFQTHGPVAVFHWRDQVNWHRNASRKQIPSLHAANSAHFQKSMAQEPKTISFAFRESETKPTLPVMGAWGGPSPDGTTVLAHVYTEYASIPSAMKHRVDQQGRVDLAKGETISRADVTREVLATLVLSPEHAMSLGQFLLEKAALALKTRREIRVENSTSNEKQ